MKMFVLLVTLVCLAAAYAAPAASAAEVAETNRVCTSDRKYEITFGPAGPERATTTWTNYACDSRFNYANTDNLDFRSSPSSLVLPGPGSAEWTHTGAASPLGFTAVATASGPDWEEREVITASGDSLRGTGVLTAAQGDGTRGVTNFVISPAGSCGTACYLTTVRSVETWVKAS